MAKSEHQKKPAVTSLCKLEIYGAVYGRSDVTEQLKDHIEDEKLTIRPRNSVFGENWKGHVKTLVVVYRYVSAPNSEIQLAIVKEGDSLTLSPPAVAVPVGKGKSLSEKLKLTILGAAYGLSDVTEKAQGVVTKVGEFKQTVSDSVWGKGPEESWPEKNKSLVVVYTSDDKTYMVDIAVQGEIMHFIASPPLYILGAAYGVKCVTEKVQALVKNRSFSARVSNSTFESGRGTRTKVLVVVYQYGDGTPTVATAKEGEQLEFLYKETPQFRSSENLTILGAAFGPRDVTQEVQAQVKGGKTLEILADVTTFHNNPWKGHRKFLVIVYRYCNEAPQVTVAQQGKRIHLRQ